MKTDLYDKKYVDYLYTRLEHFRNLSKKCTEQLQKIDDRGDDPPKKIIDIAKFSEDKFLEYSNLYQQVTHDQMMGVISVIALFAAPITVVITLVLTKTLGG